MGAWRLYMPEFSKWFLGLGQEMNSASWNPSWCDSFHLWLSFLFFKCKSHTWFKGHMKRCILRILISISMPFPFIFVDNQFHLSYQCLEQTHESHILSIIHGIVFFSFSFTICIVIPTCSSVKLFLTFLSHSSKVSPWHYWIVVDWMEHQ